MNEKFPGRETIGRGRQRQSGELLWALKAGRKKGEGGEEMLEGGGEGLESCSDCQCSRKRVDEGTITQSELKIFDKSSENQLSSEIDVSRLVFEPTQAVPGMPKETPALIINDTSVDWRQGKGT